MSREIERADQAVTFGQWITGCAAMTLLLISLGHLALRGDDIRADRMGITVEQLHQQELDETRRQISEYRAANPNTSTCGHRCIARIPTGAEQWPE